MIQRKGFPWKSLTQILRIHLQFQTPQKAKWQLPEAEIKHQCKNIMKLKLTSLEIGQFVRWSCPQNRKNNAFTSCWANVAITHKKQHVPTPRMDNNIQLLHRNNNYSFSSHFWHVWIKISTALPEYRTTASIYKYLFPFSCLLLVHGYMWQQLYWYGMTFSNKLWT